jgi:hypothetical protein
MSPLYGHPEVTGRVLVETAKPEPDLDPDIALWPIVPVSRWPFSGAPTEGRWPKGWLGIDNTATLYVCTVAGEPGTWAPVGSGGSGWPTVNGSGAGNLAAETGSGDTVGYNFTDQGSGGFNVTSSGTGPVIITAGGSSGGVDIESAAGIAVNNTGTGGATFQDLSGGGFVIRESGGVGGITLDQQGTGGLILQTTGGSGTTGIALTTQASDTAGIKLTDHSTHGVLIETTSTGEVQVISNGGVNIQNLETSIGVGISSDGPLALEVGAGGAAALTITNAGSGPITVDGPILNILSLPTADPHVAGQVWNNSGVLTLSAG